MKTTLFNCSNILSFGFDALSGPLTPYFSVQTFSIPQIPLSNFSLFLIPVLPQFLFNTPTKSLVYQFSCLFCPKVLVTHLPLIFFSLTSQVTSRKGSIHQNLKSHPGIYIQSKSVVHTVVLEKDETVL